MSNKLSNILCKSSNFYSNVLKRLNNRVYPFKNTQNSHYSYLMRLATSQPFILLTYQTIKLGRLGFSLLNLGLDVRSQLRKNHTTKQVLSVVLVFSATGCSNLPEHPHTPESIALTDYINDFYNLSLSDSLPDYSNHKVTNVPSEPHEYNFTETITHQNKMHPGLSGYHTIITGANAFAARSKLIDMATKSIDVQYYIWHNDEAGQLLLQRLWQAAERGVIVRVLLDDFNVDSILDKQLLRFASHPNIAVRLVNPLSHRKFKALNYLTDLQRINHRMHNKSMTFDRQLSIVGGRNIGNEYLSNDRSSQFADLDVLLIGNVVKDINKSFEKYWQSKVSYDIQVLLENKDHIKVHSASDEAVIHSNSSAITDFVNTLDKIQPSPRETRVDADNLSNLHTFSRALKNSTIDIDLDKNQVPFRWDKVTFLSDDVAKLYSNAYSDTLLVFQLREYLGQPRKELSIVSSYFVPTKQGVDTLIKLSKSGVKVSILTNSFKATDVAAVHSGYAKWRMPLLKAGIVIYELKSVASEEKLENKLWTAGEHSSTSLHAKTFAVDDHKVFIGSYNIDPRSANINTELGVIIEDSSMAEELHASISDTLLPIAYKVVLSTDGDLQWQTYEHKKLVIYNQEPDVDFSDGLLINIMSSLPIQWLL